MTKKSIQFYNDREVRAVRDEEHNKWWLPHQARQP